MPSISCPACRSDLDPTRVVHGQQGSLLSCARCLAIVKVACRDLTGLDQYPYAPPQAVVAGAIVARVLEILERAECLGRLPEETAQLAGAEETRMSLRVPEVFRIARPAFGSRVRFREPAGFFSFVGGRRPAGEGALPRGRVAVDRFPFKVGNGMLQEAARLGRNGGIIEPEQMHIPGYFGIAPGYDLDVLDQTAGAFLLAAPLPLRPGSSRGWPAFEGFLTPLDLLEPSGVGG